MGRKMDSHAMIDEWYIKEQRRKGNFQHIQDQAKKSGYKKGTLEFKIECLRISRDQEGDLIRYQRGIIARRQDEKNEHFRQYFSTVISDAPAFLLGPNGEILGAGSVAEELLGYSNEDIAEESLTIDHLFRESTAFRNEFDKFKAGDDNEKNSLSYDFKKKDGDFAHLKVGLKKERNGNYRMFVRRKGRYDAKQLKAHNKISVPGNLNETNVYGSVVLKQIQGVLDKIRERATKAINDDLDLGDEVASERTNLDFCNADYIPSPLYRKIEALAFALKGNLTVINAHQNDKIYTQLSSNEKIRPRLYLA